MKLQVLIPHGSDCDIYWLSSLLCFENRLTSETPAILFLNWYSHDWTHKPLIVSSYWDKFNVNASFFRGGTYIWLIHLKKCSHTIWFHFVDSQVSEKFQKCCSLFDLLLAEASVIYPWNQALEQNDKLRQFSYWLAFCQTKDVSVIIGKVTGSFPSSSSPKLTY